MRQCEPWCAAVAERLRGRAGKAQRLRRLRAEPLCRICKANGFVRASVVPDHIIPLAKGGTDDDGNVQCICQPCHDAKTREDFGHAPAIQGRGVNRSGRPTSADHPWNRARSF